MVSNEGREVWAEARSLRDLGNAMALWLEGVITFQPGYFGDEPDPETRELIPVLAPLNRQGFMTTCSQPGRLEPPSDFAQRACVDGYLSDSAWSILRDLTHSLELVVISLSPGRVAAAQVPVTYSDEQERTWGGSFYSKEDIDHIYGPHVHPDGLAVLHKAWRVHIIDPRWGRNDYLWRVVESLALRLVTPDIEDVTKLLADEYAPPPEDDS